MHRRSLLIGIGIGIIIGVLMLELFTIGEKSQEQLNAIEQQINGRDASPTPTPTPIGEETSASEDAQAPEAPASAEEPQAPTNELVEPAEPPVESEAVETPEPAQTPENTAAIFRVHPGDSITSTAKRLESNGLFNDSSQFVDYFRNHSVDIRAGFFYIEEQMTLDDLEKLFTSQPLTEAEANEHISTKGLTLIQ
ncbi:hypothetical protein [Paenibacillus camelliae]|uniref:hypothetical protein n=1 Tax=Paenibacillus camelliae TaxID=512410 RepID=UPI0020405236|nr:hypothetical protein [Paenibacillus camelliae]MCM3632008.1 hypothetical protein [Paenibacillus camelliae]